VVADHTFSTYTIPSWGAHLELATGQLDGFTGDNPIPSTTGHGVGPGWGCDSYRDARWRPSPGAAPRYVPSCVPMKNGTGPYRASPVRWVPTIMDRLTAAGRSWKLYATTTTKKQLPYGWAICPTFADCLDTGQRRGMVPTGQVLADGRDGTLPAFSVVLPAGPDSQHNTTSMRQGDNWIGQVVSAISHGPDWRSTAIFITYDDCGCFYDHVAPPPHTGIRVPMVIVSPYARPGYTDSTTATFNSMLAYTEHVFGLKPLTRGDAGAYDFSKSFDYAQAPLSAPPMHVARIPLREQRYLRVHESTADRGT
jgi:phospholipase C